MTRACHAAVRMATGDAFTDAEIDDLLDRVTQRARQAGKDAPGLSEREAIAQAAGALSKDEVKAALIEKRLKIAAEIARNQRRTRLDAMPSTMDEADRLHAYDLGSEKQGRFTAASVDAEGRARSMGLLGQVEIGLRQVPGLVDRLSNFWGQPQKDFDRLVAREMARLNGDGSIEPTGDEGALHAARVFVKALEDGRSMQNDAGAWIDRQTGYVGRQSHDRLKVAGGFWRELAEVSRRIPADGMGAFDWGAARQSAARRAFRQWRDFIRPRLDDRTFEGLTAQDVPFEKWADDAEEQAQLGRRRDLAEAAGLAARGVIDDPNSLEERMLYHVWFDIVTGRSAQLSGADDLAEFRPPASKARSVSRARVLHFKTPDAWIDYQGQYGRGSLFGGLMEQLDRAGKNTALMKRWGPSPDAARAAEIDRLAQAARLRGDPDAVTRLQGAKLAADFDSLNGRLNSPENLRLAMVLRGLRVWEGMTKLGSIVLSKATDLPMTGHTFARSGSTFLDGYKSAIEGITHLGSADAKHAAEVLHVSARSFAGFMSMGASPTEGLTGWLAKGSQLMYRINLFNALNEGVRSGAAQGLSRFLGQEAERDWNGLQIGTRESLERYGVDARMWDLARRGLETAGDGMKYFTTDQLDRLSDRDLHNYAGLTGKAATAQAAQRTRDEVRMRFLTMIHEWIDNSVSEPRARESVKLAGGLRAGTVWGEAARSFGQFRGFLQTILGRQLAPAMAGYAGRKPAALLAHFIVASSLAGWLSMNAKLISAGKAPRGLVGGDPVDTAKIWAAALAQGGGLGIYGDYLFGEQNRNGLEFTLSSIAGPAVGDLEQVAQIVRQAVHGGAVSETTGRSQIPGEAVRLGSQNIPLVNLWYTRLALDYLVLWRLQEAVSPGYLQRHEANAAADGTPFFVPPTSAAH